LPSKTDMAWMIPADDPGLEAVVVPPRKQSPLRRDVDLAKRLTGQPARGRPCRHQAVRIENVREVICGLG
jgi:hypothetical protein